jgi:hypothetical protein
MAGHGTSVLRFQKIKHAYYGECFAPDDPEARPDLRGAVE